MLVADRNHEAVDAERLQHGAQAGEAPGVDRIGGRVGAGHAAFFVPPPLPSLVCGGRRSVDLSSGGICWLTAAVDSQPTTSLHLCRPANDATTSNHLTTTPSS